MGEEFYKRQTGTVVKRNKNIQSEIDIHALEKMQKEESVQFLHFLFHRVLPQVFQQQSLFLLLIDFVRASRRLQF